MQRYFGGTEWTEHYAAEGTPPAPAVYPAYSVAAYPSTTPSAASSAAPTSPVSKGRVIALIGAAVVAVIVMIALNGGGENKRDAAVHDAASRPTV